LSRREAAAPRPFVRRGRQLSRGRDAAVTRPPRSRPG
jgi:hypothetical protein